jgi:hypothetical protein
MASPIVMAACRSAAAGSPAPASGAVESIWSMARSKPGGGVAATAGERRRENGERRREKGEEKGRRGKLPKA